jgi:hypothetical protein
VSALTDLSNKKFQSIEEEDHETTSFVVVRFPKDISGEMQCKRICNRSSLEAGR